ncbi:MAG: stage III sporulation protein AC [Ruminococcaceae bacterium]|nr:stage III sporulation protein AC [Oscillospiraceae bacterium]MBO5006278.1 stage III sporulation protein AC [Clostridia bacterium]
MNVELILKVAGVGFLVTVVYQVLSKSGRDEQAMLASVAGIIIVLLMIVGELGGLLDTVKNVFGI